MAIDPATIKVVAKAAAVLKDEDSRKTMLAMLFGALGFVAFILLLIIYILTTPLRVLGGFFGLGDLDGIEQLKLSHDDKVLIMLTDLEWTGEYPLPIQGASITSDYGDRIHPVTGKPSFHTGIDFAAYHGAPILSIADGEVVKVNTAVNSYGNYICIRHETPTETFYSFYAHMKDIYLFEGQSVKQGATIGTQGGDPNLDKNPGTSTGSHLHFEIRKTEYYGSDVDPKGYLYPSDEEESEAA